MKPVQFSRGESLMGARIEQIMKGARRSHESDATGERRRREEGKIDTWPVGQIKSRKQAIDCQGEERIGPLKSPPSGGFGFQ